MAHKLEVVSIVDAVIVDLRNRMLSGSLRQGTPLTETEVADAYQVARTTAKAAIESLVSERLLVRSAHKTARVVTLTSADVQDIYGTRELIETEVLRRLAATATVPDSARVAHGELVAVAAAEPRELIGPDMRFHRALVDAIGSERTSRAYASLASEVMLCMSYVQGAALLRSDLIVREHEEILRHVAAGDGQAAAETLSIHLRTAADRLAKIVGGET